VEFVEANAAARERILGLVQGRSEEALATRVGDDWTVAGLLGHLAFWDRVHVGRLRGAVTAGLPAPAPLPDGVTDLINNAALPSWTSLPGHAAVELWKQASSEADAYLATLDQGAVDAVRTAGYPRLIERFRHRTDHGDAIESALGADSR
jgi:hypothetical protein